MSRGSNTFIGIERKKSPRWGGLSPSRQGSVCFEGSLPEGYHRVGFESLELQAGVYILRLDAGGLSAVRKVIYLP